MLIIRSFRTVSDLIEYVVYGTVIQEVKTSNVAREVGGCSKSVAMIPDVTKHVWTTKTHTVELRGSNTDGSFTTAISNSF